MRLLIFVMLAGSALAGPVKLDSRNENDVIEALFRYQFARNGSGMNNRAPFYCLSIGQKDADPPDEVMRRFKGQKPPVVKASNCVIDKKKGAIQKKKGGKDLGVLLNIYRVTWLSDSVVTATGSYYFSTLGAGGSQYSLSKYDGKWEVTGEDEVWAK